MRFASAHAVLSLVAAAIVGSACSTTQDSSPAPDGGDDALGVYDSAPQPPPPCTGACDSDGGTCADFGGCPAFVCVAGSWSFHGGCPDGTTYALGCATNECSSDPPAVCASSEHGKCCAAAGSALCPATDAGDDASD